MSDVTYISAQSVDETAITDDRAILKGPFALFWIDLSILFKNTWYILDTVFPRTTLSPIHGVADKDSSTIFQTAIAVIVFITELAAVCASGILLFVPVWMSLSCIALVFGVVWFFQRFTWGKSIVKSNYTLSQPDFDSTSDEKWFFINRIATSHASLQYSCDRLAGTFKREITGIHNKSYGIIGDIFECLIQRCLGYYTKDVRKVFHELRAATLNQSINKVVIIAHSQGGILAALALDRMFLELPNECMAKVEVYTFGSAAAHMNNPLRYAAHTQTQSVPSNAPGTAVESEPGISNTTLAGTTDATDTTHTLQEMQPDREDVMEPDPTSESGWGPSMRQILSSPSPKDASQAALPEEHIKIELQPISSRSNSNFSHPETQDIERDAADRTENLQSSGGPRTTPETASQVAPQVASQAASQTGPQMDGSQCVHVIETIEHYCNERDMVPRWGVLYNRQHRPGQRYAGSVFIHRGERGHLFNHHYLDTMFRLPEDGEPEGMNPFLRQHVLPAEQDQPSSPAADDAVAASSSQQPGGASDVPRPLIDEADPSTDPQVETQVGAVSPSEVVTGGPSAGTPGPTVAQLSKLARYMDGGKA